MALSTVTRLERDPEQASCCRVYLDHQFAFSVHEDIVVRHLLRPGLQLDEAAVRGIVRDDECHRAFRAGLKFVGTRPRTAREVARKLRADGWEPDVIEDVLQRLKSLRYVDDEAYTRDLVEHRLRSRKKGKVWIAHELRQKGVDGDVIERALSAVSEEEERRTAYELAVKKWRAEPPHDVGKTARKIGAFLLRRGFSPSLVQSVVRELTERSGTSVHLEE